MDAPVRQLFRELADVPREQRERVLAGRRVPTRVCAELESLLNYDSARGASLTRGVEGALKDALQTDGAPIDYYCGQYRLLHLIGCGGMGAVYLAERKDGEIEQRVAVKLLRADADRPAWRGRFLRERQFLANLNHSAIARLLDAGHTSDGRPYLVMEYVDGVAIDEYAARLDVRERLKLFLLVCEGVSHAHRHSIIHRDLKPSNILVDSAGQPKILDFGIAKPAGANTDETGAFDRLLTLNYASPEQIRGGIQSTATDVYSLGAVLYKLLTGRSPREALEGACAGNIEEGQSVVAPRRLNPALPREMDPILRKALGYHAYERYASVDALAEDIRCVLESRPVEALSANAFYRAGKFMRRHRVAVAAMVVTIAGLGGGLHAAHREREIAQSRNLQVRQLANKVLALDEAMGGMHGSSQTREEILAMSKDYLEGLSTGERGDEDLALDIGAAYSHLARAQGISGIVDEGRNRQAEESLRRASHFVEPVLRTNPDSTKALLAGARLSHHRMVIAETERRKEQAVYEAGKAAGYLEKLLGRRGLSPAERGIASEFYHDVALAHKNLHLPGEGIMYARRSIEIARSLPGGAVRLALGLSLLADLQRLTGDSRASIESIREARMHLENARSVNERARRSAWVSVLWREAKVMGASGGMSLNRSNEAMAALRRAFELLEEWSRNDPEDRWSRLVFASVGRELGEMLRARDPKRSLAVYDHALSRVREIENVAEARRGEVTLLAGSAYTLRRLNRDAEAKERIDAALDVLGGIGEYPADRIAPQSPAAVALQALGDHLAETGRPPDAMRVYEDLLARVEASGPDLTNDLRHAVALSRIYGSLGDLCASGGMASRRDVLLARRLELWREWGRRLPENAFVRRQIGAAGS